MSQPPADAESKPAGNSYDELPYASFPYPQTHIAHLYTTGRLFGMQPPDFRTARVLELGSASGGNLVPMADEYPEAKFTGIDLSSVQIEQGKEFIGRLGLTNIELIHASITDYAPEGQEFDYIICHGVFSWVPEFVRESIFSTCQRYLSPNGIALISYNTLPGWNMVRSLREMMLYHCQRFPDPKEKAAQARALLQFLKESKEGTKNFFTEMIENEMAILARQPDSYLVHEHLEETNQQFYFHEFAQMAGSHGLAYLAESQVNQMFLGNYPAKVIEALKAADDLVRVEQYLDFINNRRFRSTLLCRKDVVLNRNIAIEKIEEFYVRGALAAPEQLPEGLIGDIAFRGPGGVTFTARDRATAAFGLALSKNTLKPIATQALIEQMCALCEGITSEEARSAIIRNGIRLFFAGGLFLASDPGRFITSISEKPMTLPVARQQALMTLQLTSGRHEIVTADAATCCLVRHLDGTKDVAALNALMHGHFERGDLHADKDGARITDPAQLDAIVTQLVPRILSSLAERALLIG